MEPGIVVKFNYTQSSAHILGADFSNADVLGVGNLRDGVRKQIRHAMPYYREASREVIEHFVVLRAGSLHLYNDFKTPRLFDDDRFADNCDTIFDAYSLPPHMDGRPRALALCLEGMSRDLKDFLVRTTPEYLKILCYHRGIDTIPKLEAALNDLQHPEFYPYLSTTSPQRVTELLSTLNPAAFELLVRSDKTKTIKDVADFILAERRKGQGSLFSDKCGNLPVVLDIMSFSNWEELREKLTDPYFSAVLQRADFSGIRRLFRGLIEDNERADARFAKVITSTYNVEISQPLSDLIQRLEFQRLEPDLKLYILDAFDNIYDQPGVISLLGGLVKEGFIYETNLGQSLLELSRLYNGAVTAGFAQKYHRAESAEERRQLVDQYAKLQEQVLGANPIELSDLGLASEAVYLAYRPTGFTVETIRDYIQSGRLRDLSSQLDRLKFRPEGYIMRVPMLGAVQVARFDEEKLKRIDNLLEPGKRQRLERQWVEKLWNNKLYSKEGLTRFLSAIYSRMNDSRIVDYWSECCVGADPQSGYHEGRLRRLEEILSVIPSEDEFKDHFELIFVDNPDLEASLENETERYLWGRMKGSTSQEMREFKANLDHLIKILDRDPAADVAELYQSLVSKAAPLNIHLRLPNSAEGLLLELKRVKREELLGLSRLKTARSPYHEILFREIGLIAKGLLKDVRAELSKIKTQATEGTEEIKAIVSKNVGSFFAKAGAELCTKNNFAMWSEPRHFHLNLQVRGQIIGNVMLYFEESGPLKDLLVVRGFNPRTDALTRYDRRILSLEMVRVVGEIARDNGIKEVFMPPQTAWHELSNRDGVAKEITSIARRNTTLILRSDPGARVSIQAPFSFSESVPGKDSDKDLVLLCRV